jgi:hypothetical protein
MSEAVIDAMLAHVAQLDRDGVRRLARASERQHLEPGLPFGRAAEELLESDPALRQRVEQAQDRVRAALADRLRGFPELRSDHTYKTAAQAALARAAFAVSVGGRITSPERDLLLGPWREAIDEPDFGR